MRAIVVFCSLICAVQCGEIMIKVIQEAHIGNCGSECNKCDGDGSPDVGQLEAKKAELQGKVAAAENTKNAVSGAGSSVDGLLNAVTGGGRRRHRRSAATASFPSCEDATLNIDGTVAAVILKVLDGIKAALDAIAGGNLDPTKLNCYIKITEDLTTGLGDGTYSKPDPSAITAKVNEVKSAVTSTTQAVASVINDLQDELKQTNEAIASAGGSGSVDSDIESSSISSLTTSESLGLSSAPQGIDENSNDNNPTANPAIDNGEEGQLGSDYCDKMDCEPKPKNDCIAVDVSSCCPFWNCDNLPMTCKSDNGTIYDIGASWSTESCESCYCHFIFDIGATRSCYSIENCHYHPPHKDCLFLGKDNETCCSEYFCDNTTCRSEGRYYAIGDNWLNMTDPCINCTCLEDGNATTVDCFTMQCPAPPSAECRPITRANKCCPVSWDCTDAYLITTPKKWIRGQDASICVFTRFLNGTIDIDLTFVLEDQTNTSSEARLMETGGGGSFHCSDISVPENITTGAGLRVIGFVGPANISKELPIIIYTVEKTFVQTDKYLYRPFQVVQFRILTITGTEALVSHKNVPEVWILSPRGSRLAQWTDVLNSNGIVQLEFPLAQEVEEGQYIIEVRTEGSSASQVFRVEEYTLPRFTVTIQPPPFVLVTDPEIVLLLCAKYTFGQPVSGTATLTLEKTSYYHSSNAENNSIIITQNFSGCANISVDMSSYEQLSNNEYLNAIASFAEEDTDIVMEASAPISVYDRAVIFRRFDREYYFKPELPYLFQVKASRPDSSPAEGELLSVCIEETCKNFTVDASGILTTIIPPHLVQSGSMIKVHDFNGRVDGPLGTRHTSYFYFRTESYYSPSNSSLSLDLHYDRFMCNPEGELISLPVFFVANKTSSVLLRIQLVSRSQVIYTGNSFHYLNSSDLLLDDSQLLQLLQPVGDGLVRGLFTIDITVNALSSPTLYILVWYERQDGEVVSTSAQVDVSKCLRNPTSLEWTTTSVGPPAPKDAVKITVSSSPNSICGLGVVDRSVEILSRSQPGKFSDSAIFKMLGEAEPPKWGSTQINDYEYCYGGESNNWINRKRRSGVWNYYGVTNYFDALKSFDNAGLFVLSDFTLETRPCGTSHYHRPEFPEFGLGGMANTNAPVAENEDFTEDDEDNAQGDAAESQESAKGDAPQARTYFPETWLWELVIVSESGDVAMDVQLPDTITEWVGEAVCSHPQLGFGISPTASITTFTPFFLDLSYPPVSRTNENVPVLVSVFNYLQQKIPVTVTLATSSEYTATKYMENVCIDANKKSVMDFVITPSKVGEVNLTFSASIDILNNTCGGSISIQKSDVVTRPLTVKFEGVVKENAHSDYICVDDPPVTWTVEIPDGIVENSNRVSVAASADLMGPTLENLGHLIRQPYGCGEQNMINFAPNIFIMHYLKASEQDTAVTEKKLLDYMVSGYQRELLYRHEDGSYSAFGASDESGSTWLTAFVLKSFAQAADFITVDISGLEKTTNWLLSLQNKDGCFQSVGKLFHKEMKGGLGGSSESLAPLTAYVIISLLEAGRPHDTDEITNAINCILADSSTSNYIKSLKAYALALANNSNSEALINDVYDNLGSLGLSKEIEVEAAGYLLLAMLNVNANDYGGESATVTRYISGKRNGQGGFVSTQDTVVALQSLAVFSMENPPSATNLELNITAGSQLEEISINSDNQMMLQTRKITVPAPYNVTVSPSGTGCAVVMLVQRYNVPEEKDSPVFEMSVTTERSGCSFPVNVSVCFSYLLEDAESNMAIIDVELETGMSALKEDLVALVDEGVIKRHEEEKGSLLLYLDSVPSSQTCIAIGVQKDFEVTNSLPGTVTIYDYYQPDKTITEGLQIHDPNCENVTEIAVVA